MLNRWLKGIHWPLVFSAFGLLLFGTLFVFSAGVHDSGNYLDRQVFWVGIGCLVMFLVVLVGYRTFFSVSYLFYGLSVFILILVHFMGEHRMGAQRWISLGPIVLQPSEFAKLATVIAVSNFLGSNERWGRGFHIVPTAVLMTLVPFVLILKQPDLGSAILFLPMLAVMLFLWGIRYRILILAGSLFALLVPIFWQFLKEYQKKRILVFLNPNLDPLGAGYTSIQAKIAVGSGGLFGKGYMQGTQSQLQFVPEHHTDFIFCVIGEEWGYLGSLCLLLLYGFLFRSAFQVMDNTTDPKAKFLIAGILSIMFGQIFVNIGMSFGLMPVAGVTLPLVSYGGSSLLATTIGLGLVLSIYKERSIF